MKDAESPQLPWIDPARRKPLCDVPWLGFSVVLSDGRVSFCCFTSAVVGNVNEASFDEIWNNAEMKGIRSELSEQRLPKVCQTSSCPIYRGDELHYLRKRMGDVKSPVDSARHALEATDLKISQNAQGSESAKLSIANSGASLEVDALVAIKHPDGGLAFLPDGDRFPIPCAYKTVASGYGHTVLEFELPDDPSAAKSDGEVWAALVLPESNPSLMQNVLWAGKVARNGDGGS